MFSKLVIGLSCTLSEFIATYHKSILQVPGVPHLFMKKILLTSLRVVLIKHHLHLVQMLSVLTYGKFIRKRPINIQHYKHPGPYF